MSETKTLHHYIGGEKVEGGSGRFGPVFNPGTDEEAARVPFASADEVRGAIRAAADALPGWAVTPLVTNQNDSTILVQDILTFCTQIKQPPLADTLIITQEYVL